MNWNKNPPPFGVNPQYSSFHYQSNRFEPEPAKPKYEDYTHKPGKPGGGWDVEEEPSVIRQPVNRFENMPRNETFRNPQQFNPEPVLEQRTEPRIEQRNEIKPTLAVSEQAGIYEKVLVNDITTPGGVRPRPSDKDMHEFINKCKYLSPDVVLPLLFAQLENSQRAFVRFM